MPQQCADYRRLNAVQRAQLAAPGYETMARTSASAPDAGMLAHHEHRTRQALAGDGADGHCPGDSLAAPMLARLYPPDDVSTDTGEAAQTAALTPASQAVSQRRPL